LKVPATSKRQVPVFANIDPSTSSTASDDAKLDMDLNMSIDDVRREDNEDNEPFIDSDDDDNDVEDSDD
jgi:hypothetical protein